MGWGKDTTTGHQWCLVVHARPLQASRVKPEKKNSTSKQKIAMARTAGQLFPGGQTLKTYSSAVGKGS